MCLLRTAVASLLVLSAIAAGCGGDPSTTQERPSDGSPVIARVGEDTITRAQFNHWLEIFATASPLAGTEPIVPDPPRFERCVRALHNLPVPAGRKVPDRRALLAACRQGNRLLKQQTMEFLIQAKWIEREARVAGIRLSDEQVSARFERETSDTFPDKTQLAAALAQTGRTPEDARFQLRLTLLQGALMRKAKEDVEVSDREVARYYRRNRGDFEGPLGLAAESVRRVLRAKREEQLLSRFTGRIAAGQRAKTWCARGFVAPQCGNAPGKS